MSNCLEVALALQSLLQQVRTADGYATDAGERVFVQVDEFSDLDEYPLLAVIFEGEQGPERGRRIGCPHVQMSGDYLVVGAIKANSVTGDTGPLNLIADIKRALFRQVAPAQLTSKSIEIEHIDSTALPHLDGDAHNEVQVRLKAQWQELITP